MNPNLSFCEMTCNLCPDEAECFVQCEGGTRCFCAFCVELWWGLWRQTPVEVFYAD